MLGDWRPYDEPLGPRVDLDDSLERNNDLMATIHVANDYRFRFAELLIRPEHAVDPTDGVTGLVYNPIPLTVGG
jgi:hypothetical protein